MKKQFVNDNVSHYVNTNFTELEVACMMNFINMVSYTFKDGMVACGSGKNYRFLIKSNGNFRFTIEVNQRDTKADVDTIFKSMMNNVFNSIAYIVDELPVVYARFELNDSVVGYPYGELTSLFGMPTAEALRLLPRTMSPGGIAGIDEFKTDITIDGNEGLRVIVDCAEKAKIITMCVYDRRHKGGFTSISKPDSRAYFNVLHNELKRVGLV